MYKIVFENMEFYFLCYKKEEMDLVEMYYDPIKDIYCWYFNAYLAYKEWKNGFLNLKDKELAIILLTIAASRYIIYKLDEKKFQNIWEYYKIKKDRWIIEWDIKRIIKKLDK